MDYKTFDSQLNTEPLVLTAPYYNAINPTIVSFPREHVQVSMDALGHIAVSDENGNPLAAIELPVSKDPSKYGHTAQYGNMRCAADGSTVTVFLPVYYWSDNYPYCDGESDRWDRHISQWFRVVFDCGTGQLTILDRD